MLTLTPVPKRTGAKVMIDSGLVALTLIIAKRKERIVCNQLIASVADRMDPLQFDYRARKGYGAGRCNVNPPPPHFCHLDSTGITVRVLVTNLSSAFNSIQPHVLMKRLLDRGSNTDLVLWIRQFLCDQPQRLCLNFSFRVR